MYPSAISPIYVSRLIFPNVAYQPKTVWIIYHNSALDKHTYKVINNLKNTDLRVNDIHLARVWSHVIEYNTPIHKVMNGQCDRNVKYIIHKELNTYQFRECAGEFMRYVNHNSDGPDYFSSS